MSDRPPPSRSRTGGKRGSDVYDHLSDGEPGCCGDCGVYGALYSVSIGNLDLRRVCSGCFQRIVADFANMIQRRNRGAKPAKARVFNWKKEGF